MKFFFFIRKIQLVILLVMALSCSPDNSTKKEAHYVSIPGTPITLVPPAGYILAADIGGFKHAHLTSTIMVLETPTGFETVANGFKTDEISRQGGEQLFSEAVTVDSTKAMLYKIFRPSQGLNFMQWVLALQVGDHTLTINGTYLKENDKELSEKIKSALLSTRISKNSVIDKNVLAFDINPATLKFAKLLEGPSAMFTKSGHWNDSSIFKLSFFAGPSANYSGIEQSEEFAIGQLKEVCADCKVDKNGVSKIEIDSLKGYEVVSYRVDTTQDLKRLKYEVILYDSNKYYLLVGTASEDYEKNLSMFKTVSRSFKRKRS